MVILIYIYFHPRWVFSSPYSSLFYHIFVKYIHSTCEWKMCFFFSLKVLLNARCLFEWRKRLVLIEWPRYHFNIFTSFFKWRLICVGLAFLKSFVDVRWNNSVVKIINIWVGLGLIQTSKQIQKQIFWFLKEKMTILISFDQNCSRNILNSIANIINFMIMRAVNSVVFQWILYCLQEIKSYLFLNVIIALLSKLDGIRDSFKLNL